MISPKLRRQLQGFRTHVGDRNARRTMVLRDQSEQLSDRSGAGYEDPLPGHIAGPSGGLEHNGQRLEKGRLTPGQLLRNNVAALGQGGHELPETPIHVGHQGG